MVPALAREVGARHVHCAEDFGPYGARRDDEVVATLAGQEAELVRIGSPYAVPTGTVFTQAGDPFQVFTPFSRAWRAHGWDDPVRRPASPHFPGAGDGVRSDAVPDAPDVAAEPPRAGEDAAKRRLDRFLDRHVAEYHERRDHPGEPATSRLSVDLKYGCIHPRQILARLGRQGRAEPKGEQVFRTELCWREFYADVLASRPETARESFQPRMKRMRVDDGAEADRRFEAWTEGRTGYPIVDAGMRQLAGEAWVHNRVRMIVASFLVKDLHVDWGRGARYFLQHLVDGDLASNNHGWQWTAGTGTDASPYVRVFNPVLQSKKFDADGTYIHRWVPELRGVDPPLLHEPWKAGGDLFAASADRGYPPPIVDHFSERDDALARYAEL
ncbi:deoxyribodipyrimidine photo-lyase [soil metagenome]